MKTSIIHISEYLWQKFEKMNNWSLQLMSIIKCGYFIIKKNFWCNLYKNSVFGDFRDFFSVFAFCPKRCLKVLDLKYSKASRYMASRSTDLGDTRFLIGAQNTWDTRFLAQSLADTRLLLSWKKCDNFFHRIWSSSILGYIIFYLMCMYLKV